LGEAFVKRSRALDVVRGLAILMVLCWHYQPEKPLISDFLLYSTRLFWSGVDVFFVLSGFLIAGILLQNVDKKNYFSVFYIRRSARILPLYLILCFIFYLLLRFDPEIFYKTYKYHLPLWSYLTFTQNFFYAARQRFADPWMDVTWSLAVEEQFYIFLSLLIYNIKKKHLYVVAVFLILLAPVLRSSSSYITSYILPFHRADSLMFGLLLALAWRSEDIKEFLKKYNLVLKWTCFIFFIGAAYLTYQQKHFGDNFTHSWLAFFYSNVILLALLSDPIARWSIFKNRVLEWFGLRSYGLYLFHQPIHIVFPVLLHWLNIKLNPWIGIAVMVIVLCMVSEITYRLIEKPFLDLGRKFKYMDS
jgi:peptidoglycan/LPS O-acetylase OafA/YrhL